jgi:hypothetical protein
MKETIKEFINLKNESIIQMDVSELECTKKFCNQKNPRLCSIKYYTQISTNNFPFYFHHGKRYTLRKVLISLENKKNR